MSKDFKDIINNSINFGASELKGIKTTYLCKLPVWRMNRGIRKLVSRKKEKGQFKLQYIGDFYEKSFREMIIDYLDEERRYKQIKNNATVV